MNFPVVIVPVLSRIMADKLDDCCNASPFRISVPYSAAFPIPTITEMGAANPKAQGHAMAGGTTSDGINIIRTIPVNLSTNKRTGAELGVLYNPEKWLRLNSSFNFFQKLI